MTQIFGAKGQITQRIKTYFRNFYIKKERITEVLSLQRCFQLVLIDLAKLSFLQVMYWFFLAYVQVLTKNIFFFIE